jgi:hypothetical protein
MRLNEINKPLHDLAERIAAKYKANEFEEFEQEMLTLMPKAMREQANLPQLFDLYNPQRQQEGAVSWNRMMKKAREGEYPAMEARAPLAKAKVGDTIRVGQQGTRDKHLDKVTKITPKGTVKTRSGKFQFNQNTGMAKGQKLKTFAQIATDKDKEQDFRDFALNFLKQRINDELTTEQIEAILKILRISTYDARTEKYTSV